MLKHIFFDAEGFALSQVQTFSAPHFLFLWRVKEKENAPLAVEKKKKAFWVLIGSLVRKTNYGTCVSAECLSICSAFLFAAADAEFFDHCHGSGSGKRSRSIRDAASLAKAKYVVRGSVCRYAPIAFSFSSVPSTAHLLFLSLAKEKEDVPLTVQKKKKTLWVQIGSQPL